jgi:hypothetical protein
MEAKRWCIPIARTGLSIKRSKELLLLAQSGHSSTSGSGPLSGGKGKWDGYADAIKGVTAESAVVIRALESARSPAAQLEHWSKQKPPTFAAAKPTVAPRAAPVRSEPTVTAARADGLTAPQRRVMTSLAFRKSIGHQTPTREQVAAVAGYRPGSGNFNNIIGGLSTMGQTTVPAPGRLSINVDFEPLSSDEARDKLWSVFENPQRKLVEAAKEIDGDLSRDELATNAGYAPGSGNSTTSPANSAAWTFCNEPVPAAWRCPIGRARSCSEARWNDKGDSIPVKPTRICTVCTGSGWAPSPSPTSERRK